MQYTKKKFTLPVAAPGTAQKNWDRAFLSPDEFKAKWPTLSARVETACAQDIAPHGWWCTRDKGHDGPCAAIPYHQCNGWS